jgi:hypothetical protein
VKGQELRNAEARYFRRIPYKSETKVRPFAFLGFVRGEFQCQPVIAEPPACMCVCVCVCLSNVSKIWQPRRFATLCVSRACFRNSVTSFLSALQLAVAQLLRYYRYYRYYPSFMQPEDSAQEPATCPQPTSWLCYEHGMHTLREHAIIQPPLMSDYTASHLWLLSS